MKAKLETRTLSGFATRKIDWLFPPFIPRGTITSICGDGEVGKSTVIYDILSRITVAEAMPSFGGDLAGEPTKGSVVILCKEDDPGLMMKPRLKAAGADMSKVHLLGVQKTSAKEDFEVIGRLDDAFAAFEEQIAAIGDVRAVLIDPITDFAGDLNIFREEHVRRLLSPLSRVAARYNIAIINILHLVKDTKRKARHRAQGSVALMNISRSVLMVGASAQTNRRYLMMDKANLWPEKKSAAFVISSSDGQPVVDWETEWEDVNVDDVLQGRSAHVTKQQQAAFKLRSMLADGPMPALNVQRIAAADGVHFNTFKLAKKEIGARSEKRADGWWWSLPQEGKGTSEQAEPPIERMRLAYSQDDDN